LEYSRRSKKDDEKKEEVDKEEDDRDEAILLTSNGVQHGLRSTICTLRYAAAMCTVQ
jgi:hypothetical protein